MPRSQGTSRKGKPKKADRAAGMGRSLQRYVPLGETNTCIISLSLFVLSCVTNPCFGKERMLISTNVIRTDLLVGRGA